VSVSEGRNLARTRRLVLEGSRRRGTVSARRLALRRLSLLAAKISLPMLAMLLLALVALWPEIAHLTERTRLSFRRVFAVAAQSGRMLEPHYRGVDQRGRPYTITARWATQAGPNRIDMGEPKSDMVLESGHWLQTESKNGVYLQHSEELDMSDDVVLYRDDGTVMRTSSAAVDLRQGAASGNEQTHAEGPFGVLDAQGFTLTDKGGAIQFQGPARLIINETAKPAQPPAAEAAK